MLIIYLKTVTSQGFSYVSTVAVHTNERLAEFIRTVNKGAILEKNIHVFMKGEIEVREQSNTLFVGWTKPIPLTGNRVLPPSGLLFEGYGMLEPRCNAISNGWQGQLKAIILKRLLRFIILHLYSVRGLWTFSSETTYLHIFLGNSTV
jgi:hypothetical protein